MIYFLNPSTPKKEHPKSVIIVERQTISINELTFSMYRDTCESRAFMQAGFELISTYISMAQEYLPTPYTRSTSIPSVAIK
jgi:hypothetical protein